MAFVITPESGAVPDGEAATVYVGDRVRVSTFWHAFYGLRGVVTSLEPTMVRLDGYSMPYAIGPESLTRLASGPWPCAVPRGVQ